MSEADELPRPLALVAASRDGARLASRLGGSWPWAERHVALRYLEEAGQDAAPLADDLQGAVGALFQRCRALVFFLPVGAVVRLVAPHLESKLRDPAVVAVDDAGRFAVSLVSGHAGGGNRLAERVGQVLGATAVVTTAAEQRGVPVPELLGRPYGWRLEATPAALLRASAALVNGDTIAVYQDAGARDWLSANVRARLVDRLEEVGRAALEAAILVTDRRIEPSLAARSVVWRPRRLVLGIGCSSGAPLAELERLIDESLDEAGLARGGVGCIASLDRKLAEPAIAELTRRLGAQTRGFPSAALARIEVPSPSEVVRRAVGTPSVAEAAALLASDGGELVSSKRSSAHATVAVAQRRP